VGLDILPGRILDRAQVGADETWWRLMQKKPTKRWWTWSLTCPNAVWYAIAPSRSAKTARRILDGFEGTCSGNIITDCGEDTSCYGCLRSYRNQFVHQNLQRGPVFNFLGKIISMLT